jgi:hypothetical protein
MSTFMGTVRRLLAERTSSAHVVALAHELGDLERTSGAPRLERCLERLAERLREAGASEVELHSFPAGPGARYFGWTLERRPLTVRAELALLLADGREQPLCRSPEEPGCLMGAFRATPSEGEVFEVVDVGFGTRARDYGAQRMAGKLAFASGHQFQAAMHEALVARHAEGLLCGPGSEQTTVPNRLAEPSLFERRRPFGFNLDRARYNLLARRLAAEEEVRVRVRIEQSLDSGALSALSARLAGSDLAEESVLLVVDAAEVGAAACLVETLRVIASAVVAGTLPPLRRSLVLLAAPAPAGIVAWLAANQERAGASGWPRALIQLSCEGIDARAIHAGVCGLPGAPSFLADLLLDHLGGAACALEPTSGLSASPRRYRAGALLPAAGLPLPGLARVAARGAPGGEGARDGLRELCAGLVSALHDLATLDEADLPRLLTGSQLKGAGRLLERLEAVRAEGAEELALARARAEGSGAAARHLLWLAELALAEGLRRERAALQSCAAYLRGPGSHALRLAEASTDLESLVAALERALHAEVASALGPRTKLQLRRRPLSALERRAQATTVHRAGEGPPPLATLLRDAAPADREWLAHSADALACQPSGEELLGLVDGRRSLLEIVDLLALDHPELDLRLIRRYLETLAGAGIVRLEEEPRISSPEAEADAGSAPGAQARATTQPLDREGES